MLILIFIVQFLLNPNIIVFGLTQPGLESTICHTQGEHVNHFTTDEV
jgi:hypothetical protein